MGYNAVFLAINRGGIIVAKEVVMNAEDADFMRKYEAFKKANERHFPTFLMEQDLHDLLKKFEKNSVLIGRLAEWPMAHVC